jgi:polyisoprenoid-binding protein YceI
MKKPNKGNNKRGVIMKKSFVLIVLGMVMLLVPAMASATTWNIDPEHSSIMFKVSHLGLVEVKGSFRKYQGAVTLDEGNIAKSSVTVAIEAASIDTGIEKRDEHLRTNDFFDVAKYPTINFISKKVAPAGKGKLKVTGDLTICGITKEVVLDVTGPGKELQDPWGNIRRGGSATTTINRKDFGLTYNKILDNGVMVIGNKVTINLETELIKAKDK